MLLKESAPKLLAYKDTPAKKSDAKDVTMAIFSSQMDALIHARDIE
jgi:hypothetical protein